MIQGSGTPVDEPHETPSIPEPNVQTYNLVMEAWLQLGDAARVQDLLLEMDASNIVSPNSESFSKVIRSWLQEEMNHQTPRYGLSGLSCENAWKWLKELLERERMGHSDLGPAPELFSSILKTAARTPSRGENLLILGQDTFWVNPSSFYCIDLFVKTRVYVYSHHAIWSSSFKRQCESLDLESILSPTNGCWRLHSKFYTLPKIS